MNNLYRSSNQTHLNNATSHGFARRVVVGVALFMVVQSAMLMLLSQTLFGTTPGVTQAIRFALTCALAFFVYAGSNIARYLTIAFYGFGALMSATALPAVYEKQGLVFTLVLGLLVLANAMIPVLLIAPSGVDEQFS